MTGVAVKKGVDLDAHLNEVDYKILNSNDYVPSAFALEFMNFIKLVNGAVGEANKTPPVHLKMLDKLSGQRRYVVNLCFRGAAKTTLFMEYMTLYVAVFGSLPGFGDISGMIYVSDSMDNGVKSARKNIEFRYNNSPFLQEWLPEAKFTDNYLEFKNKMGHQLGVKMFGAKTGIRGTKIFGKRPTFCILDDLVSDDDAKSATSMETIKDTVYKGVFPALDPTKRKVVFNGTPFNKSDIIIEAVESGAWDVNVWPVCERFPCERKDFVGAWEDRFTYDFIQEQYDMAVQTGKLSAFYQEYMLRITSEEDRLIHDHDIRWYSRDSLLANRGNYNFYITTDFATSAKQSADYSVISVWAYNANGDWFWVDGIAKRQTMDATVEALFRLVHEYQPQYVGVEVTGQQGGFIPWLQEEMMRRNIWFNFASSEKSGAPGIRSQGDKLSRMNMVVPWFKAGKFYWPKEWANSEIVGLFMGQIRLTTVNGIKGKDDCLDTISQLAYIKPWKPASGRPDDGPMPQAPRNDLYWSAPVEEQVSPMASYIV